MTKNPLLRLLRYVSPPGGVKNRGGVLALGLSDGRPGQSGPAAGSGADVHAGGVDTIDIDTNRAGGVAGWVCVTGEGQIGGLCQ